MRKPPGSLSPTGITELEKIDLSKPENWEKFVLREELKDPNNPKTKLRRWWAMFVLEMFSSRYDGQLYNSHRKIVPCINKSMSGNVFESGLDCTLGDMFYTDYKRNQLHRNYFNIENLDNMVDHMLERMNKRKASSLMTFVGNQQKSERSLGFCIQGLALTNAGNNSMYVHMAYRTTEVIKKFGADLIFLTQDVWPHIKNRLRREVDLVNVGFAFPSVSLSCMYLPTVLHLLLEPIGFLEMLRQTDENLFYQSVRFIYIALEEGDRWKYKQRQICIRDFQTAVKSKSFDQQSVVDYCLNFFDPNQMARRR